MINSQEKQYFDIFPINSIIRYNLGPKLGRSYLRYGFSPFLNDFEQNS